jgi:hypothetical protein
MTSSSETATAGNFGAASSATTSVDDKAISVVTAAIFSKFDMISPVRGTTATRLFVFKMSGKEG